MDQMFWKPLIEIIEVKRMERVFNIYWKGVVHIWRENHNLFYVKIVNSIYVVNGLMQWWRKND